MIAFMNQDTMDCTKGRASPGRLGSVEDVAPTVYCRIAGSSASITEQGAQFDGGITP